MHGICVVKTFVIFICCCPQAETQFLPFSLDNSNSNEFVQPPKLSFLDGVPINPTRILKKKGKRTTTVKPNESYDNDNDESYEPSTIAPLVCNHRIPLNCSYTEFKKCKRCFENCIVCTQEKYEAKGEEKWAAHTLITCSVSKCFQVIIDHYQS